jgi:hypothetical protein
MPEFKTKDICAAHRTHDCRNTKQESQPDNCAACSACKLSSYRLSYSGTSTNCRDSLNGTVVVKRNFKPSDTRNHNRFHIQVTVRFESTENPGVSKPQVYKGIQSSEGSIRRGSCRV